MNNLHETSFGGKSPRRSKAGFTLIELLIVMIILGLLATLVAPKFLHKVSTARLQTAKTQITMFGTALDAYRLDIGKYPTTDEGLAALRKNPGYNKWDGPYLDKDPPGDPWDRPYIYRSPGEHGLYDLYSLGADGQEGGDGENADVVSWN
jgi:general secretion pathway protein G